MRRYAIPVIVFALGCVLWRAAGPARRLKHPGSVLAVAFSQDGSRLACASYDFDATGPAAHGTLALWDTAASRRVWRVATPAIVRSLALSPNGTWVATLGEVGTGSSSRDIRIWDAASGSAVTTLPSSPCFWDRGVAFSPDSRVLAVADSEWRERGQAVSLYDTSTWQHIGKLFGFQWGYIVDVAFSPDGALVAACAVERETGTAEVAAWRTDTGRLVIHLGDLAWWTPGPLLFPADGRTLVSGPFAVEVGRSHRRPTNYCRRSGPSHERHVIGWYAPQEQQVLVETTATDVLEYPEPTLALDVWDVPSGTCVARWRGSRFLTRPLGGSVRLWGDGHPLAFAPGPRLLAVAEYDGTVSLWRVQPSAMEACALPRKGGAGGSR